MQAPTRQGLLWIRLTPLFSRLSTASKHLITPHIVAQLLKLARSVSLEDRRDAMFAGARINTTEDRAVLHTALRGRSRARAADLRRQWADATQPRGRLSEPRPDTQLHGRTRRAAAVVASHPAPGNPRIVNNVQSR
ncbi:MAG: hypothetical protein EOO27_18650 [Comamonadaceae bacterium]|nr:MAG: hypothetical protein EOO27_18650 [Comamonadaceae bacterium]